MKDDLSALLTLICVVFLGFRFEVGDKITPTHPLSKTYARNFQFGT